MQLAELLAKIAMLAPGRVRITFNGHVTVWIAKFLGLDHTYDTMALHYDSAQKNLTGNPDDWESMDLDGEVMHLNDLYEISEPEAGAIRFRWWRFPDREYTISK